MARVGSVTVEVLPDATGWVDKLKAQIMPGIDRLGHDVGTTLGERAGSAARERINLALKDLKATITVDIDSRGAEAKLAALAQSANAAGDRSGRASASVGELGNAAERAATGAAHARTSLDQLNTVTDVASRKSAALMNAERGLADAHQKVADTEQKIVAAHRAANAAAPDPAQINRLSGAYRTLASAEENVGLSQRKLALLAATPVGEDDERRAIALTAAQNSLSRAMRTLTGSEESLVSANDDLVRSGKVSQKQVDDIIGGERAHARALGDVQIATQRLAEVQMSAAAKAEQAAIKEADAVAREATRGANASIRESDRAAAAVERDALRSRTALERAAGAASGSGNDSGGGSVFNKIIAALLAIAPALVPLGAAAIGAFTGLAVGAGVALLAFKGIQAAMKAGTTLGRTYSASLGVIKSDFASLATTAATGMFAGIARSINVVHLAMPQLTSQTKAYSTILGSVTEHATKGLLGGLVVMQPVITMILNLVDRMAVKFDGFATGGGLNKFVDYLVKNLPAIGRALAAVGTAIGHLFQAASSSGMGVLKVFEIMGDAINRIPIKTLDALVGTLFSVWTASKLIGAVSSVYTTLKIKLEGVAAAQLLAADNIAVIVAAQATAAALTETTAAAAVAATESVAIAEGAAAGIGEAAAAMAAAVVAADDIVITANEAVGAAFVVANGEMDTATLAMAEVHARAAVVVATSDAAMIASAAALADGTVSADAEIGAAQLAIIELTDAMAVAVSAAYDAVALAAVEAAGGPIAADEAITAAHLELLAATEALAAASAASDAAMSATAAAMAAAKVAADEAIVAADVELTAAEVAAALAADALAASLSAIDVVGFPLLIAGLATVGVALAALIGTYLVYKAAATDPGAPVTGRGGGTINKIRQVADNLNPDNWLSSNDDPGNPGTTGYKKKQTADYDAKQAAKDLADRKANALATIASIKAQKQADLDLAAAEQTANGIGNTYAGSFTDLAKSTGIAASTLQSYASMVGITTDAVSNGEITTARLTKTVTGVASAYKFADASTAGYLNAIATFSASAGTAADKGALIGATLKASQGDALGFVGALAGVYGANLTLVKSFTDEAKAVKAGTTAYGDSEKAAIKFTGGIKGALTASIDYTKVGAGPLISALQSIQDAAVTAASATYQHEAATGDLTKASEDAARIYKTQTYSALISEAAQLGLTAAQATALADAYFKMPDTVTTTVVDEGTQEVIDTLTQIGQMLADFVGKPWHAVVGVQSAGAIANIAALQARINAIKQGKVPGLTATNVAGKTAIANLQAGIDNIKQGKPPGVTVDTADTVGKINALQLHLNALKQANPPMIGVDTSAAEFNMRNLQMEIDALKNKTIFIAMVPTTAPATQQVAGSLGMIHKAYATGGLEKHLAQIASTKPGTVRVWAEPETQGEAYIPLANDHRRAGAQDILRRTAAMIGVETMAAGGISAAAAQRAVTAANKAAAKASATAREKVTAAHAQVAFTLDYQDFPKLLSAVKGTAAGVAAVMAAIITAVHTAATKGVGHDIVATLSKENAQLQALATKRAAIADKLATVQASIADEAATISAATYKSFDITSIGYTDAGSLESVLATKVAQAAKFKADLATAQKRGVNADYIKALAEGGADTGATTAATLAGSSAADIARINALNKALAGTSAALGSTIAGGLPYAAGAQTAAGYAAGLASQLKAVQAAASKLAATVIAQLKKDLGIHSPSTVMREHGQNTGTGFALGISDQAALVAEAASHLSSAAIPNARVATASLPVTSTNTNGGVNVKVFIGETELTDIVRIEVADAQDLLRNRLVHGVNQ